MRNSVLQRPEAQDAGTIILTGFEPEIVLSSVRTVINEYNELTARNSQLETCLPNRQAHSQQLTAPNEYNITNTSWRVLKLILGNAALSNKWWGINK